MVFAVFQIRPIRTCQTNSCISLTFDRSIDSIVCEGEEATISFSNFSSQKYAISLNGSDFSKTNSYSLEINRDSLLNFLFIDSGELNCPPKPLDISVDFVPKGNTDLVFDKEGICLGDSLSIQADANYGSYEFFKNGLNAQNGAEAIFRDAEPTNGDQYYALLEADRSCIFVSDTIEAIVNALPVTGFIATVSGKEVTFEDTTSGNIQDRFWDLGDGNSAFMANFTHLYSVSDTYVVQLTNTDENACQGSFTQEIIIEESTGFEKFELAEVKVYPNPATSIIYIENLPQEFLNIRILNAQGAEMGIYNTGSGQTQIDINQFPKGLYYLTFSLENEFNSKAFIVQ